MDQEQNVPREVELEARYQLATQAIGDLVVQQQASKQVIARLQADLVAERERADGLEAIVRTMTADETTPAPKNGKPKTDAPV